MDNFEVLRALRDSPCSRIKSVVMSVIDLHPDSQKMKVCFVIMGFGKKTDFESGRTLDLDATYESIIQPAVAAQNMRCIRADEIVHSGIIDTEMYEMLLRADLVIADISTGNVNAVYELGVRHALRPNSTIIMVEDEGRLYFDLNHVSTFRYNHIGFDIAAREARRASTALGELIAAVMVSKKPDSPVYTYLPRLQRPLLTDEQYAELLDDAEAAQTKLAGLMHRAQMFTNASRHADAKEMLKLAAKMKPGEPFILQQLALATYKAQVPTVLVALFEAMDVLDILTPELSNDPETLGIAGAICRRLWLELREPVYLDLAIKHYGRGFEVRRDYYNGENLALCYEYRGERQTNPDEMKFDFMFARKVRVAVVEGLDDILSMDDAGDRSDIKWVYASLSNCLLALGRVEEAAAYEAEFMFNMSTVWMIETFQKGKSEIFNLQPNRRSNA